MVCWFAQREKKTKSALDPRSNRGHQIQFLNIYKFIDRI